MTRAAPLVLFAPASGPGVGGGHVMRCLALAEALAERGVRCVFAVAAAGEILLARFAPRPFETLRRYALPTLLCDGLRPDVLVLDDYATGFGEERALAQSAGRLVVIDDLADRPHPAHLLLDTGYGRQEADYDELLPEDARRLIGPAYALLRPAFAALRPTTLARPIAKAPQRLFVSFGLSDVDGVAGRAAILARAAFPAAEIDLALSAAAESLPSLRILTSSDPRLRLHVDATDTPALMAAADLALGAGGASTWERACLGLPTVAVVVAENQRPTITALSRDGALLAAGLQAPNFEADMLDALERLKPPETRSLLRTRSSALCDGRGAERVAGAILAMLD